MNVNKIGRFVLRAMLALLAGAIVLIVLGGLFLTRPFTEEPWEEAPPHPVSIYRGGESGSATAAEIPLISPFHLQADPMKALLLINFGEDPDSIYVGFEPQSFDDALHGTGLLVIGWRLDGRVDVFHQEGLRLDPRTYGITGKGLHEMVERPFSEAILEFGPAGVHADITFRDLQGRQVRLIVKESDLRGRTPFGLLAPMGGDAHDPPALPLVYVDQFYFVRQAGTEILIEIDGRSHQGDSIPLILDGTRVHFHRYSMAPFIVTWNPDTEAMVRTLEAHPEGDSGLLVSHADGVRYELEANGAYREIRRMSLREDEHEILVEFTPAIPQLLALADGATAAGAFRITAQAGLGTVRGSWSVSRQDRELHLEITPEGGWTPGPAPRMARLLFRAVPIFREWPATYRWRGTIQLPPPDGRPEMPPSKLFEAPLAFHSGWERIAR